MKSEVRIGGRRTFVHSDTLMAARARTEAKEREAAMATHEIHGRNDAKLETLTDAQLEPLTNRPKGLVAKLAEVMAAAERVPKRGRNTFHNYDYATEADIAATIRQELASRSVMLIPAVVEMTREPVGEKGSVLTTLKMTFTFFDGDSHEQIERTWYGAGTDKEDKGLYKAMTGAEKYFLLKTFLMPTGDDPEREDEPKGREARQNDQRRRSVEQAPYAERERVKAIGSNYLIHPKAEPVRAPVLEGERPAHITEDGGVMNPGEPSAPSGPPPEVTGEGARNHPGTPTGEANWSKLQERMKTWPAEIAAIIPPDEATYLMPDLEAESNRQLYVDGIKDMAARRKLSAQEKRELAFMFFGAANARPETANVYVLRAMWRFLDPERP